MFHLYVMLLHLCIKRLHNMGSVLAIQLHRSGIKNLFPNYFSLILYHHVTYSDIWLLDSKQLIH